MIRRRLLTLFALAAGVLWAPAALADTREVARFAGTTCQEVLTELPLADSAALRSEVPEDWALTDSFFYQSPSVFLHVMQCTDLTVAGGSEPGTSIAWASAPATTWRSTDFLYTLRVHTTHKALGDALRRSGHAGGLLPGVRTELTRTPAGTLIAGTGTVPDGPDAYTVTVAGPLAHDGSLLGSQFWRFGHEGPAGLAQMHVNWTDIEWGIGTAVVRVEPGSYLARILGSTVASGIGYVRQARVAGIVKAEKPLL